MTASEYFATEIYRQHEQEMIQRLEWQRRATERAGSSIATPAVNHGWRTAMGSRFRIIQAFVRHQPVRG